MKITIEFSTDNAAFEGRDPATAAEMVIRASARTLARLKWKNGASVPLFDENGNRVGTATVQEDS